MVWLSLGRMSLQLEGTLGTCLWALATRCEAQCTFCFASTYLMLFLPGLWHIALQLCDCVLLSAFRICLLRSSSRSICLRILFECHISVIYFACCILDASHAKGQQSSLPSLACCEVRDAVCMLCTSCVSVQGVSTVMRVSSWKLVLTALQSWCTCSDQEGSPGARQS